MCLPSSTRNHLVALGVEDDPMCMLDPYMSGTETFLENDIVLNDFA